ncbi:hypothetical protein [Paenibacillus polysaccharolyticus]|uniref:hypothetical protein n=1 Tax=Paenibacillus polysaccharolyticus TaxID=582692 RepID=UPI00300A1B16
MSNATQTSNAVTFREVQRKANAGERIKVVNAGYAGNPPAYTNGDELTAIRDNGNIGVRVDRKWRDGSFINAWISHDEYVVLEPIASPAPITVGLPDLFAQFIRDNACAVRSYLTEIDSVESVDVTQSAPLTRAKVIEMARERVVYLTERLPFNGEIKFRINRERRTVVAEVYRNGVRTGKFYAKCAPDDVFNADIGKAIAAERALGLTLTDAFVNAPKPAEPVVGMIVRDDSGTGPVLEVRPRGYIGWQNGMTVRGEHGEFWTFIHGKLSGTIIDDTDADYAEEGVKDGEAA